MISRELLVCHPSTSRLDLDVLFFESAGWRSRIFRTVASAAEAARYSPNAVGLVVLDSPTSGPADLEPLVTHGDMKWIAVLSKYWLHSPDCMRFVLENFYDYHTLPLDPQRLMVTLGHAHGMAIMRQYLNHRQERVEYYGMVGKSAPMRDLYAKLERVTKADAPVLVLGESGTGKELVARAIHQHSARAQGPFVPVNCGGLPGNLVQSELFGHEKGSFTGAYQRKIGSIEAAGGGVIFLDEIGDLPLDLQANLLRFLQEKTIVRVGSSQRIPIDVRVIAATHVNLQNAVSQNHFREDLYYRLNVLHLDVPPLRDRPDDIELLALECLRTFNGQKKSAVVRGFAREAIRVMLEYQWPGNVRELFNRVQRAVIMCENRLITPTDLGLPGLVNGKPPITLQSARATIEENVIRLTLQKHDNNVSMAARELAVSRVTLYRLIGKFKLRIN
jgi:DNA-binding NtrC family response regulator